MKKIIIALFCYFLLGNVSAQNKFSVGFEVFGGLSKNTLATSTGEIFWKKNFRMGIPVSYDLTEKWTLQSGLFYLNTGYRREFSNLQWGSQHNGEGGFDPTLPGEYDEAALNYNFNFIDIPLTAIYNFKQSTKEKFYLKAGIAALIHTSTYIVSEVDGDSANAVKQADPSKRYTSPNLSLQAGFGWSHLFKNERARFFLEPRFEVLPFGYRKSAVENDRLMTFGIAAGIML